MGSSTAVEEHAPTGVWRSVWGGCTCGCRVMQRVGAPTAPEEHMGCVHPELRRSTHGACTHGYGGVHWVCAPTLM